MWKSAPKICASTFFARQARAASMSTRRNRRCTDHRINLTLYSLERIMEGELEPLVEALGTAAQAEALKAQSA